MNIFRIVWPEIPEIEGIELGLANTDDAEFIGLLSHYYVETGLTGWSWHPERVAAQIRNPEALVIVGRADEIVVAAAIVEYRKYEGHLDLLAVEPAFQRLGIGTCLMKYLERSASLEGHSKMSLEVRLNNRTARAFYRSLGYEEQEIKKDYYRGNEAALYMSRLIKPYPMTSLLSDYP